MNGNPIGDEDLLRRLPLPLAQLYRRALNAKTPLERHQAGYYLWEAALKLLGSVAVVEYAELGTSNPQLAERLENLARPSTGHWWEFVRLLTPVLADAGDKQFAAIRDLLLGRTRDDLPRAAGLDASVCEVFDGRGGARITVRLSELFDRLVRYRNRLLGHGAAGQHANEFYERMSRALLSGVPEILGRLDVLAGRRLVYVADVRRQSSGQWLIEQYELRGENAQRIASLEWPEADTAGLPKPDRVYLATSDGDTARLRALHPLLLFDVEAKEALYLNAQRGRDRLEYLSYTTGRVLDRTDLGSEQRQLLSRVLGQPIVADQVGQWAAKSQAEEQAESPADEQPADDSAAPRRLGEFELLSELGRGGMGVVYRAWQPSLGRQVALKSMLRSGDPKAEVRFAREIRVLGRVEHPHLIKVFTSGSEADRWFYSMELVEGATLAAVCDKVSARSTQAASVDLNTWHEALSTVYAETRKAEKSLSTASDSTANGQTALADMASRSHALPALHGPPGRSFVRHLVELICQVADAAHSLHEAGVVHRDIKPGNIMLSADGSQVVLMDLGLAQLIDETEGRLTRTRQFVGTLRYASPEQVLAAAKVDRRSDVYSLGATLWELLTLRPMFAATDDTPTPDLMQRIQFKDVEHVRKYNLSVLPDLDAIVLKCLEKDPDHRYATARDLAEDLRRFLGGEPVVARPVGELARAWRWCRRNPLVSGLLAAVVLALAVGLAGMTWKWRDAVEQQHIAETNLSRAVKAEKDAADEADHARREADKAKANQQRAESAEKLAAQKAQEASQQAETVKQALKFLVNMFGTSATNKGKGTSLTADEILVRGEQLADQLTSLPQTQAELLDAVGNVYRNLGQADMAGHCLLKAVQICQQRLGTDHPTYATALNSLGMYFQATGDLASAEPTLRLALQIRHRVLGEKHPDYATSLNNLAGVYRAQGDDAKAAPFYAQALQINLATLDKNKWGDAASWSSFAALYVSLGDYAKAEPYYQRALELTKTASGDQSAEYAASLDNLSRVYQITGQLTKAAPLLSQALEIRRLLRKTDSPEFVAELANLAALYEAFGDFAKAEPLLREAAEIQRKLHGEQSPEYAYTLASLANLAYQTGNFADAEQLYKQAMAILKQPAGSRDASYATLLYGLGWTYLKTKNFTAAQPVLEQSLQIRKETLGTKSALYAESLGALAELYNESGKAAQAEPLYLEALQVAGETLGTKHLDYAAILNNLAFFYCNNGEYAKAEPRFEEALRITKDALGNRSPNYAMMLINLAGLHLAAGQPAKSEPLCREALDIVRQQLDLTAPVQSERQQLKMLASRQIFLDGYLLAAPLAQVPAEQMYAQVLAWKGSIVIRQQKLRRLHAIVAAEKSPETSRLLDQWTERTRELSNLSLAAPALDQPDEQAQRIARLNEQIVQLEQKLAALSPEFRRQRVARRLKPAALQASLPPDVALVDFVEYGRFTPAEKGSVPTWPRQLAAFVVRPGRPIVRVEFGPVEPLWAAVASWRKEFANPTGSQPPAGAKQLRELLWEKLLPHLAGAKLVLLSPDGPAACFPWPALPGLQPGSCLIEDTALVVVPVVGMLPELLAQAQGDAASQPSAPLGKPSLLLVSDVDYDAQQAQSNAESAQSVAIADDPVGPRLSLSALPKMSAEISAVGKLFQQQFSAGHLQALSGSGASASAVAAALRGCHYAELATYNYAAPLEFARAKSGPPLIDFPSLLYDPAGLGSGLALAGVNHATRPERGDGVLNDAEIARLDLRGLDLLVLPLGETDSAEQPAGIAALEAARAFQLAGVATVVATPWPIDADARRAVMSEFYHNLWVKKLTKLESLRQAQLKLLRADGNHRSPYFWAPYILSGDWR